MRTVRVVQSPSRTVRVPHAIVDEMGVEVGDEVEIAVQDTMLVAAPDLVDVGEKFTTEMRYNEAKGFVLELPRSARNKNKLVLVQGCGEMRILTLEDFEYRVFSPGSKAAGFRGGLGTDE